jgi:hypothetical protein
MNTNLYSIVAIAGMAVLTAAAQTPVLLRTFNNPTPNADDYFGSAMAVLGNDRVLIGASFDDITATNAGIVYLFHTNGTLLTTITKPPAIIGGFGADIATLGNNRIAVGSGYGGSLHLFATNGVGLTNISLMSGNVSAIAGVGNDKLLIGDHWADEDPQAYATYGAAYLYSTNGALLTTFNNLNPGQSPGLASQWQLSAVIAYWSARAPNGADSGSLTSSTPMARC